MRDRARGVRLALAIVALARWLVPPRDRSPWAREWEGELRARRNELEARGALNARARIDLASRALGAIPDALSYGYGRRMTMGTWADMRLAMRTLRRRPGFAALVIGIMAVGVGGSTAMYGVARDVLLRPFPYHDSGSVVVLETFEAGQPHLSGNVSYPNIADLSASTSSFEAIAAARWWVPTLEQEEGAVVVRGATVTSDFFEVLGVEPGQGRFFRTEEQGEGRENLVVLSHGLWVERFGADPGVVGGDVRLGGAPYRVIGVTDASFEDPWLLDGPGSEPRLWRTVWSPPADWPRSGRSWRALARLSSGVSLEVAQAEVDASFGALVAAHPDHNANHGMRIMPLLDRVVGPSRPALLVLLGAVGLLLLIACANIASLMLARALDRETELAVHRSLGASPARIVARWAWEAILLAGVGGLLGVGLAQIAGFWTTRLDAFLPRPVSGAVDLGALAFAIATTVACGAFFGAAPAVHSLRSGRGVPGREGGRTATAGLRGHRTRRGLVAGQIALTSALLVGSGLLAKTFLHLGSVDLGLRPEGVVGMELHGSAWAGLEPAAGQAQWNEVLTAARRVPGVASVGAIDYLPLGGSYSCDGVSREDLPEPGPGEGRCAEVRVVLPGALETLGVDLVQGRPIEARDDVDAVPVAVVDETMVRAFWPDSDSDAVGGRIRVHQRVHEVVGVVRSMRHFGPGEDLRPMVYLSAPQEGWNGVSRGLTLVVRGESGGGIEPGLRAAVRRVRPDIAIAEVNGLEGLLAETLAAPRFRASLMITFGMTALLLSLLGVAGVMASSVARRRKELGVRLALGAAPGEVRDMVMGEGAAMVAIGVVTGLAAAVALSGALRTVLFEVPPLDPVVYLLVGALLSLTAAFACWLPARRAAQLDPVAALHSE